MNLLHETVNVVSPKCPVGTSLLNPAAAIQFYLICSNKDFVSCGVCSGNRQQILVLDLRPNVTHSHRL